MDSATLAIVAFVVGTIIGFNPYMLRLFLSYITALKGRGVSNGRYSMAGAMVIVCIGFVLFCIGILFANSYDMLEHDSHLAIALLLALGGVISGLAMVRRYFWYNPFRLISKEAESYLHALSTKKRGIISALILGFSIFVITLPNIGLVLACFVSIAGETNNSTFTWIIPYTIAVLLPMYGMLALFSSGNRTVALVSWLAKGKGTMMLYAGICLIFVAWMVLYTFIQTGRTV